MFIYVCLMDKYIYTYILLLLQHFTALYANCKIISFTKALVKVEGQSCKLNIYIYFFNGLVIQICLLVLMSLLDGFEMERFSLKSIYLLFIYIHKAEGHSSPLSYPSHSSFPGGTLRKTQLGFIPDVNFLSLYCFSLAFVWYSTLRRANLQLCLFGT